MFLGPWYTAPIVRRVSKDWRNRKKSKAYEVAANEMFARTSPKSAPWTLVAADDKRHARLLVLETLCERLEQALEPI